jgi:hypothetical protein
MFRPDRVALMDCTWQASIFRICNYSLSAARHAAVAHTAPTTSSSLVIFLISRSQ